MIDKSSHILKSLTELKSGEAFLCILDFRLRANDFGLTLKFACFMEINIRVILFG